MANEIKLKSSVVPGKVPLTTDLGLGIVAINNEDGKLYIGKTTSGVVTSVVEVGAGGGTTYTSGTGINITGNVITATTGINQANVAITGGSISGVALSTSSDVLINGYTFGRGAANNNTSFVFGQNALASDVYGNQQGAIGTNALQNMGKVLTAGNFIPGIQYKIVSSGDTSFTSIGASNNNVGTTFTATGIGSGTGTAAASNSYRNLAIGYGAMTTATAGSRNTVVGRNAMTGSVYPQNALTFGTGAGWYTNGTFIISIGQQCNLFSGPSSSVISIGNSAGTFLSNLPATSIVAGKSYVITDPGNTDFVSIGSPNNFSETKFIATGVGSGTGFVMPADVQNTGPGNNNVLIGTNAGAPDAGNVKVTNALMTGTDNILIGNYSGTTDSAMTNSIIIGNSLIASNSNETIIGTSATVTTTLGGKLLIASAPASAIGAAGDVAGMISADASYIYHCTGAYDGSTAIWLRVAGSTW